MNEAAGSVKGFLETGDHRLKIRLETWFMCVPRHLGCADTDVEWRGKQTYLQPFQHCPMVGEGASSLPPCV